MGYWGKILGCLFGLMFGGPLGAILGLILGHSFDTGLHSLDAINYNAEKIDHIKSEFFNATFSVMGHLARADGVVTTAEISMATRLMDEMELSQQQRMVAIELFRLGKTNNFNLDLTLKNLMMACKWRYDLLQVFVEIQFQAAYADGEIKPQEKQMLIYLCKTLGFSDMDYARFEALYGYRYTGNTNYQRQNQSNFANNNRDFASSLQKAYKILGVDSTTTQANLKKAYRKLMSQHHPDKLIAKGLPEEMLKIAKEKTQEIQAAYEEIKLAKGWV